MGLEEIEPIFGEAKAEWSAPNSPPLRPFLFWVHALGSSSLRVIVTDFHSNTFEAVRSIEQLEDMVSIPFPLIFLPYVWLLREKNGN